MYKITGIFIALLSVTHVLHGITVSGDLLDHCPLLYLLDLDNFIKDASVTQQIGNILYSKDFLDTVTPHGTITGAYSERPTQPAEGYQFFQGQWAWVPSALNSTEGTWYWIVRAHSYYLSLFIRDV